MDILFPNQQPDPAAWESRPFSPGSLDGPRTTDNHDRHTMLMGIEPAGPPVADGPYRRVARAILEYRIFPPRLAERVVKRTPLQVGDVVGLCYPLILGVRMFFASRVIDVFDGPTEQGWRSGFTYRTLEGHVEIGEEIFAVEKNARTGEVTASLTAWSRPGHWLTRIGYPYARWCQIQAGKAALRFLRRVAARQNACG
jgi:uncharacterized protein (UPF0548 family)